MAVASSSNLKLNFPSRNKPSPFNSKARLDLKLAGCIPVNQQVDSGIMCESCSGRGWLLCEFCKGQKTNAKTTESNRTYRRCPLVNPLVVAIFTLFTVMESITRQFAS